MVGFPIVFPEDVFNKIANLSQTSFSTTSVGLLYLANFSSVLLFQRMLPIDPFARDITVSTQLYCRPILSSVDGGIRGSFLFLCTVDSFTLSRENVTNIYLSTSVLFTSLSLTQSSLPVQAVAILSQKFPLV